MKAVAGDGSSVLVYCLREEESRRLVTSDSEDPQIPIDTEMVVGRSTEEEVVYICPFSIGAVDMSYEDPYGIV